MDWNFKQIYLHTTLPRSHLTQVRGLKWFKFHRIISAIEVAPHAGAWIEISSRYIYIRHCPGRTSRRCVDWNGEDALFEQIIHRRTSRRCVDWNAFLSNVLSYILQSHLTQVRGLKFTVQKNWCSEGGSRTSRRCVDWNAFTILFNCSKQGRTSRRCVDWNIECDLSSSVTVTSHLTQVRGLK